ncbi:sugar porter family MFS transporter [Aspergillus stella-maris]|uniref:sugar porter family MFS transporter n=1 Tax=Aspergillus stella-maris TaxID=1810926 RepID=UPI003CCDAB3E
MPSRANTLQYAQILLAVAPAFILYGYNQAGASALLDTPDLVRYMPQIDTVNTTGSTNATNSTIKGLVNGCLQLGALVGALSCSFLGDLLGRRKTSFVAALITAVGQILQCTSFSLPQFVISRIILGFGVGQLSVIVPVWQAESSDAGKRGRKVITAGIFICFGFTLTSWINFGCSKSSIPSVQWRVPLAIPILFPLIICASVFRLPESPRWLVSKRRIQEATDTLARLNGLENTNELIRHEISLIQAAIESAPSVSLKEVLDPNDRHRLAYRLALCLSIQTLQQLVGGSLISIYSTTVFQDLKLSGDLPTILAAACLTWKFLCSFIAFAVVDRFGRRPIFVVSGTGMSLCMVALAVATSYPESNQAASISGAVFLFIYNLCYPIGFLGGNFLYCTEIAPAHLRSAMSSISTANHWLWNFIIAMVTPVAIESIGYKYYIVFACTCACVPLVVLPFFPETMNRNLELIDAVFRMRTVFGILCLWRDGCRGGMQGLKMLR